MRWSVIAPVTKVPSNSEIVTSIGHGLRGIARFSGRDPRARFWPYAIAVMLTGNAIGMVAAIPTFLRSFVDMRELAERHPDQFVVRETPTSYSMSYVGNDPAVAAAMMPDVQPFFVMVWVVAAMTAILLAAACTRRLHDRSISGRWLVVPVVFSMPALWLMPGLFDEVRASSETIGA